MAGGTGAYPSYLTQLVKSPVPSIHPSLLILNSGSQGRCSLSHPPQGEGRIHPGPITQRDKQSLTLTFKAMDNLDDLEHANSTQKEHPERYFGKLCLQIWSWSHPSIPSSCSRHAGGFVLGPLLNATYIHCKMLFTFVIQQWLISFWI